MQFFAVHVLETCKNVQLYVIVIIVLTLHSSIPLSLGTFLFHLSFVGLISVLWLPLVLVQDTDKFLNVWWKIVVLIDEVFLLFSLEIID